LLIWHLHTERTLFVVFIVKGLCEVSWMVPLTVAERRGAGRIE
jgi:hypothetical protein